MQQRRTWPLLLTTALALVLANELLAATQEIGVFSSQPPGGVVPDGWERWLPSAEGKLTRWKLVQEGEATKLRALSSASGSGLVRRMAVDLDATPILAWSWQVLEHPKGSDLSRTGRNDAAARVCALFGDGGVAQTESAAAMSAFGGALPSLLGEPAAASALCYAWVATGTSDTILTSPSSPLVRNFVAEVGSARGDVVEKHDVAADFTRAFGSPPGPLLAIALFTDSDATGTVASAYFGDVTLGPR